MTTGDPVVVVDGLVKRYGPRRVLDGVSMTVARGELVALLGPNGAGKTTTVEMLEGLHQPDSGSIELFGVSWGTGKDRELRERFGVQLQDTQLADKLKVAEVLELFGSFYPRGPSVDELVRLVGLEEIDDGIWNVYFGPLKLGRLLDRHMKIEDAYGRLLRHGA